MFSLVQCKTSSMRGHLLRIRLTKSCFQAKPTDYHSIAGAQTNDFFIILSLFLSGCNTISFHIVWLFSPDLVGLNSPLLSLSIEEAMSTSGWACLLVSADRRLRIA